MTGKTNIKFGWLWLLVGILMAMGLGLFAFQPDWLGGYASLERRFLRLAHISLVALSLTNILYGLCLDSARLTDRLKTAGSRAMIVAAVFMPVLCLLSMFHSFFQLFFFIPAVSFAAAVLIMALGVSRGRS